MTRHVIFTCKAVDGREVTLYRDRYDTHILPEHPELARDYDDPESQIEHALVNATKVTSGKGKAKIYIGPPVQANPPAGAQQIYVVVLPESQGNGWWVITAWAVLVLVW
jgi:hypothetical protein